MFGANVTIRPLKNRETCIDINVPKIQEVEAPLGGTSVEYEISIFTTLELFKSHLHNKDDVIHFSVYKAYKEIEDFHDKVMKKFSNNDIPSIPKGRLVAKCNVEEKRSALDKFMHHVSQHKDICDSSLFIQFLGIKCKQKRSSISEQLTEITLHDNELHYITSDLENVESQNKNCLNNNSENISATISDENTDDHRISQLFPKMKVRKPSKSDAFEIRDDDESKSLSSSPFDNEECDQKEEITKEEDLDLFEEVQKMKIEGKKESKENSLFSDKGSPHRGLFDDLDSSSSDLFLSPQKEIINSESDISLFSSEVKVSPMKTTNKQIKVKPKTERLFRDEDEIEEKTKPSGGVSLFEEQDLGLSITKDDEELFFVAKSPTCVVNTLLSPSTEDISDEEITESLDELVTLTEPNEASPETESALLDTQDKKLPPKPIPKPRARTSIPSEDTFKKPPVPPRTVFPSKPSLPPKPVVPPKPKPRAKPSTVAQPNAKDSHASSDIKVQGDQKSMFEGLGNLDILQYIEHEEKTTTTETSLFD